MLRLLSLPLWERGLKFQRGSETGHHGGVAPLVGAWIEITQFSFFPTARSSLPLWARGLKFLKAESFFADSQSLPLWERGLKCLLSSYPISHTKVAPLVGAWIEIFLFFASSSFIQSLPLWERGLKFPKILAFTSV